jgi:cytochrome c biogenesis protein CcmG/thiol:disulfide interchange protein DsbE
MYISRRSFMLPGILFWIVTIGTVNAEPVKVPDLMLETAQGKLSLDKLQGQVVYVDFWASWCGPCRKSFPWMNQMQQRYGNKGFKIVAVNVDSDQALANKFLTEHNANFTIAYDPQGKAASAFKVKGMPNSYLIDRNGQIHSSHIGFREKDVASMEAEIKALIKQ